MKETTTNQSCENVRDKIEYIIAQLNLTAKAVGDLQKLQSLMSNAVGFAMPARIAAYDPDEATMEASDEAFARTMANLNQSKIKDPLRVMLSYATILGTMIMARKGFERKTKKLDNTIASESVGKDERNAACCVKAKVNESLRVCDKRIEMVLNYFFKARTKVITAVNKIDEEVFKLIPHGSEAVRTACLNNSAADQIMILGTDENHFKRGKETL